jgi:hypothetical protein
LIAARTPQAIPKVVAEAKGSWGWKLVVSCHHVAIRRRMSYHVKSKSERKQQTTKVKECRELS